MILESSYWKRDLFHSANELLRRQHQKRWLGSSHASLEKTIMLGFYSIRKLIEAHKVSDRIVRNVIKIKRYSRLNKRVDLLNYHRVIELYNFQLPQKGSLSLNKLCHQLIHSYVFQPCFDDKKRLYSILFNSDFTRNQCVFEISVEQIRSLFIEISKNDPKSIRMKRDCKTRDFKVYIGDNME